jgi:hypothetical protein
MKTFIKFSKIVLGSWIKPLEFDLCHKDLGPIFPRYRPSQDNCNKCSTRRYTKVLTIADKKKPSTPQEGIARTPKTEITKLSISNKKTLHKKQSISNPP